MDSIEINKEIEKIKTGSYDKGQWTDAERGIKDLISEIPALDLKSLFKVQCLCGWVKWKMSKKVDAYRLWAVVAGNDFASPIDRISARCGMMIFLSENERNKNRVLGCIDALRQDLDGIGAEYFTAVCLNSAGIALAKIGEYYEAENTLIAALEMNSKLGNIHQAAKNMYNLASLVLIPSGNMDRARENLIEAVEKYNQVGAETDIAAACFRLSQIALKEGNLQQALDYESQSARIWQKHEKDDPRRLEASKVNMTKILVLMGLEASKIEKEIEKILS